MFKKKEAEIEFPMLEMGQEIVLMRRKYKLTPSEYVQVLEGVIDATKKTLDEWPKELVDFLNKKK